MKGISCTFKLTGKTWAGIRYVGQHLCLQLQLYCLCEKSVHILHLSVCKETVMHQGLCLRQLTVWLCWSSPHSPGGRCCIRRTPGVKPTPNLHHLIWKWCCCLEKGWRREKRWCHVSCNINYITVISDPSTPCSRWLTPLMAWNLSLNTTCWTFCQEDVKLSRRGLDYCSPR